MTFHAYWEHEKGVKVWTKKKSSLLHVNTHNWFTLVTLTIDWKRILIYHSARHSNPCFAPPRAPGIQDAQFVQFFSEWMAPGLWQWSPQPSQNPQLPSPKHQLQFRPRAVHENGSKFSPTQLWISKKTKPKNAAQRNPRSVPDAIAIKKLLCRKLV